jgi:hypothetical protein
MGRALRTDRVPWQVIGMVLFVASFGYATAFADSWLEELRHSSTFVEIRLFGMNRPEKTLDKDGPNMLLVCRDSAFSVVINWRKPVGKLRESRRHLFYHVDGYSHLMLPVVDKTGESTGYSNQSEKAKSLVHEIFTSTTRDFIPIGVFPAGADPVTGDWIDAWFSTEAFKRAALSAGKACKFDPREPRPDLHSADKIPPAQPGSS